MTPYRLPNESQWDYAYRRGEEWAEFMLTPELWRWLGEQTERRKQMISRETAANIWNAYREIEAGEKLLADMAKIRETERTDRLAPTLKDAFGVRRQLQLGIPSGENGHRLLDVSPVLAESCIRAHIERKRAELAEANEQARIELG